MGNLRIHGILINLKCGGPLLCRNMGDGKAAGHCIHSTTPPTHRLMDIPPNLNISKSPLPRLCCRTSTFQTHTSTRPHTLHTKHCQSSIEGTLSLLLCFKPASSLKSRNTPHTMPRAWQSPRPKPTELRTEENSD
ncbi:hypothetical protein L798_07912 [Zootermopsis nevadensis]|uniref:Uncharacterized protein n=1 Tax=Zootermopsis nevadensis TaxID=136037 RepID=A0A067RJC9_ZOONE|nr:hypothetical protein L798_07912 [Zootermopsis nevadensis]